MRHILVVPLTIVLLTATLAALAVSPLTIEAKIGYSGYYRTQVLVPISLHVTNKGGDTITGEFRVVSDDEMTFPDDFRALVTIPRDADQRLTLYVIVDRPTRDMRVEFRGQGKVIAKTPIDGARELADTDRLVVAVGGMGSAIPYVDALPITITEDTQTRQRPWANGSRPALQYRGPEERTKGVAGTVRLAYCDPSILPDNPEAYRSISMLALMSDVTENTLPISTQDAIMQWTQAGGHLLLAGGGVTARLTASFFTAVSPKTGQAGAQTLTLSETAQAHSVSFAGGRVTQLNFDPDSLAGGNWDSVRTFFTKIVTMPMRLPISIQARDIANRALVIRNLRPPNLMVIIAFLLVYLIILVPVNYFVLRKLDRRELAWVTTPAIVLVFTVGAYGIGYLTKGHRLITNMTSIIETTTGMRATEAFSQLLVFSPSRTTYRLGMGDTGYVVAEYQPSDEYEYRRQQNLRAPLTQVTNGNALLIDGIRINMWDFRQFALVNRIDLGKGFACDLRPDPAGVAHVIGTVTNGTPYHLPVCSLYVKGVVADTFALAPGQTITLGTAKHQIAEIPFSDSARAMYDTMHKEVAMQGVKEGMALVAYTNDIQLPVTVSSRKPTTHMTMMVVHLR